MWCTSIIMFYVMFSAFTVSLVSIFCWNSRYAFFPWGLVTIRCWLLVSYTAEGKYEANAIFPLAGQLLSFLPEYIEESILGNFKIHAFRHWAVCRCRSFGPCFCFLGTQGAFPIRRWRLHNISEFFLLIHLWTLFFFYSAFFFFFKVYLFLEFQKPSSKSDQFLLKSVSTLSFVHSYPRASSPHPWLWLPRRKFWGLFPSV